MYQPKTGAKCGCRKGIQRDNCSNCEGTGMVVDFNAIRAMKMCTALIGDDISHSPNPGQIVDGGGLCVECNGFIPNKGVK